MVVADLAVRLRAVRFGATSLPATSRILGAATAIAITILAQLGRAGPARHATAVGVETSITTVCGAIRINTTLVCLAIRIVTSTTAIATISGTNNFGVTANRTAFV